MDKLISDSGDPEVQIMGFKDDFFLFDDSSLLSTRLESPVLDSGGIPGQRVSVSVLVVPKCLPSVDTLSSELSTLVPPPPPYILK
jgi:hypothetical protein